MARQSLFGNDERLAIARQRLEQSIVTIDFMQAPFEARRSGSPPASPPIDQAPYLEEEDETFDQASWDEWYRERIRRSLADPRPPIPHAEVIEILAERSASVDLRIFIHHGRSAEAARSAFSAHASQSPR